MQKETGKSGAELCKWIQEAKSFQPYKNWISDCKDAWCEYLSLPNTQALTDTSATVNSQSRVRTKMPLFWASIQNLTPAYYARTPETVARRRFEGDDPVGRTMCLIYEGLSKTRLAKYPLEPAMPEAVREFLLCDRGTARIFLEEELEQVPVMVPVLMLETGEVVNAETGEPVEGEPIQDPSGLMFIETIEERVVKVHTQILPVAYDEVLHDNHAKYFQDIQRMAFKLCLNKQEIVRQFGNEWLAKLKQGAYEQGEGENGYSEDTDTYEVYEVWDKPTETVTYVSPSYKDEVIKEIPDPYQLETFFPVAPFIIGTKHHKYLFGVPMYVQLRDCLNQIHTLFSRMGTLIKGLKRRGIANATLSSLVNAIVSNDDAEIVVTDRFNELVEGGQKLSDLIYWVPVQELSSAVVECKELVADYKQYFFELSGVPDVVRGVTDAQETAASQQMKGNFYNVRTSWNQHQVQEQARWLAQAQCDLALNRLPDEEILRESGAEFFPEENKEFIPQALMMLKDKDNRNIRLEIETDSLTLMANERKQAERAMLVETILTGLGRVQEIVTASPEMGKIAMDMLLYTVRGIDLGKEFEQEVQKTAMEIRELVENPPEEEPLPDYEQMKLEVQQAKMQMDGQIAQAKMQIEGQKAQTDTMVKMRELDQKELKMMLEQQVGGFEQQIEAAYLELDRQKEYFNQQIEAQRLQLEQFLGTLQEKEKLIEEARLASQLQNEMDESGTGGKATPASNIIINNMPAVPQPITAPIAPVVDPLEAAIVAAAIDEGIV